MSEVEKEFDVVPGVPGDVSITLGDRTCTFTYECTGGRSEKWKISATKEGPFTCMIGRPSPPSYLLFQSFSATIKTGSVGDVEVWDNSGVILINDQYVVEGGVVKPAKNWGGNLALIIIHQV